MEELYWITIMIIYMVWFAWFALKKTGYER